jgi:hypothetical protein
VYTKIQEDCEKRLATTPKIETIRVYFPKGGKVMQVSFLNLAWGIFNLMSERRGQSNDDTYKSFKDGAQ